MRIAVNDRRRDRWSAATLLAQVVFMLSELLFVRALFSRGCRSAALFA